jgi:hypothetical protein
MANSLGFSYNAPSVLLNIKKALKDFRTGNNALANQAAGTQVDVVGHSMGGLVTRTLETLPGFKDQSSFGVGNVHKLVTIGTPHFGSPLAVQLLNPSNNCVRKLLAKEGNLAFSTVTIVGSSDPVNGAILDLQGDAPGVPLSAALQALKTPPNPNEAKTALIAAKMTTANLVGNGVTTGVGCVKCATAALWLACGVVGGDPLASSLTVPAWPTIFSNPDGTHDSDSVVSLSSQLARLATQSIFSGAIHSSGMEGLGFVGPAELDPGSGVPAFLINLLNAPLSPAAGDPRAGVFLFYRLSQSQ